MQNQVDSAAADAGSGGVAMDSVSTFASHITPYRCTAVGKEDPSSQSGGEANIYFPNFAKWIIDRDFEDPEISCFSNGRCLEFLGTNFYGGEFILNDDGERVYSEAFGKFLKTEITPSGEYLDELFKSYKIDQYTPEKAIELMNIQFPNQDWEDILEKYIAGKTGGSL